MIRVLRFVAAVILLMSTAACTQTKQNEEWRTSPVFSIYDTTPDGRRIEYKVRGEEGHFGFLDAPFVAGKKQKYMWYFWGEPSEFVGKQLRVTGVKKGTDQEIQVLNASLGGQNRSATAHVPSEMLLPTPGLWRLNIYVGDKLLGNIVVDVN
jgi:hypothetical protein